MREVEMTWEELKLLILLNMIKEIRVEAIIKQSPRGAQVIQFPKDRIVSKQG
jgi:hypothetical protein